MDDHRERSDELVLLTGTSRAVFSTESGRLTGLTFGDRQLIVAAPADPTPPGSWHWGAFVMAPWTSLIRDARFSFDGRDRRLAIDDGRHAVLGLTWKLPWRIEQQGLSCELPRSEAGDDWPYGGRVMIMPELGPDRLRVRLRVQAGDLAMPAAIGWHPWFVRELAGSGSARLGLSGPVWRQHRDAEEAPTGLWGATRPGDQEFNDCLWAAGPTTLRWPGVGALTVDHDSPFVTVYSTDPRGICVEPVTSPAERMDHRLEPGESLDLTIDLTWRPIEEND